MGDAGVLLLILMVVLTGGCLVLGWIDHKISKLKEENELHIETIGSIIALERAMKKLNEALRTESKSFSDYKQRLRCLERRIDILESGHPDSEFDYATTDDDGNALEVWFNGKKYVPEDKLDEDAMTVYADGRIVAETTRPDVRCCATCNKYEAASTPCVSSDKAEYIRYDRMYKALGGDGATEESLKRIKKLNYIYNTGLISMAEYRRRWEELKQNDS